MLTPRDIYTWLAEMKQELEKQQLPDGNYLITSDLMKDLVRQLVIKQISIEALEILEREGVELASEALSRIRKVDFA